MLHSKNQTVDVPAHSRVANVVAESSQTPSWAVSQRTELWPIISPLPIHLSFLKLSAGCHSSLPPTAPLSQPPTHTFIYGPHKHTPTDTHGALMKWIPLYQQRTGHLAQWTAMNNSARRGDGKDRRGKVEMRERGESRPRNAREPQDGRGGSLPRCEPQRRGDTRDEQSRSNLLSQ